MNEIIGPIYYVFAQHPDPKWKGKLPAVVIMLLYFFVEHAEADTFFCFSNLMVEIGDHFTKKFDRSRAGIGMSLIID